MNSTSQGGGLAAQSQVALSRQQAILSMMKRTAEIQSANVQAVAETATTQKSQNTVDPSATRGVNLDIEV